MAETSRQKTRLMLATARAKINAGPFCCCMHLPAGCDAHVVWLDAVQTYEALEQWLR